MILATIGVIVAQYNRGLWYMGATEPALAHIFGVGIVLMLDFTWNRRSSEQAFE